MIENAVWKVGGNTYVNIVEVVPATVYKNERLNLTENKTEYTAKVGLMYVSDYGFAADPSAWTRKLGVDSGNGYGNNIVKAVNWIYMGLSEWTITRKSDENYTVFHLPDGGNLNFNNTDGAFAIRPTFYLLPSIVYSGGSGTQSNPIRLEV